ncbi:MAG TPA: CARDB domain-containing protein, partial [Phycisphaerae bacterium]|nr:CARDB domain-containing protein [Phycisphaerae bacterium]
MTETLLKFLGLWASGNEKLVGVRPTAYAAVHPAVLVLLGVLLAAGVAWLYRREQAELTPVRRITAAVCRILLIGILLLILARPVLAITTSASASDSLALLIDTSSSMQIADVRDLPEDRARAAIAAGTLDPRAGLQQAPASSMPATPRLELVKSALRNPKLELTGQLRKHFQLSMFSFDRQLADIPMQANWIDTLQPRGSATALGDAIERLLVARRGENLAGIVIVTDGASNTGTLLPNAARLARDEHVPLYVYGVGITSPRDIQASTLLAPELAFIHNELPVAVRVRAQGYASREVKLALRLDGATVATSTLTLDSGGEQTIPMKFTPEKTGTFTLEAAIDPLPDEVVTDNNTTSARQLRVVDTRIRVLHIEQAPRWEFKYLQVMMQRDPRIEYHCWLLDAETAPGAAAQPGIVTAFPNARDLSNYDLIILGDVDPRRLPAGAMEQMNSFVANEGGGFVMMAGPRAAPLGYRRTPIERMLPVDFETTGMIAAASEGEQPIALELTPAGNANTMLRLEDDPAANQRRWERLAP